MARKKIVYVIVEGPSDEDALGVVLNQLFDKNEVHIEVCHCDITSDRGTTVNNICDKIGKLIKQYAKDHSFKPEHFQQIIHLTDTDGVYIPKENIVLNTEAEEPLYSLTAIETWNPDGIAYRNQMKAAVLNRLISTSSVWRVPYRIYYMSCNLDHVLYNKLNSSDEEKEADSYAFQKKYARDPEGFRDYICGSDFSVVVGYKESWKFIQEPLRSLERYTNFGLALPEAKPKAQETMTETSALIASSSSG